jgi:hypothetical protein
MKVAWGLAQASEAIISFVQQMVESAEELTKKEKGVKDKMRESIS